jgi:hypothetical protein
MRKLGNDKIGSNEPANQLRGKVAHVAGFAGGKTEAFDEPTDGGCNAQANLISSSPSASGIEPANSCGSVAPRRGYR